MEPLIDIGLGAALLMAVCAGMALVVRSYMRRYRRSVARLAGALAVKRLFFPGPGRDLTELQLELRRGVDATRRLVEHAASKGGSLGELPVLLQRLSRIGESLDSELEALRHDPHAALQRSSLADARRRVGELLDMAARIRAAALEAVSPTLELAELRRDLQDELTAVTAWRAAYGSLARNQ